MGSPRPYNVHLLSLPRIIVPQEKYGVILRTQAFNVCWLLSGVIIQYNEPYVMMLRA